MEAVNKKLVELISHCACEGEEGPGNCPDRKHGLCNEIQKLDYCAVQNLADRLAGNGVRIPVLCGECKSFEPYREDKHSKGECGNPDGLAKQLCPTDFCSCGERKE